MISRFSSSVRSIVSLAGPFLVPNTVDIACRSFAWTALRNCWTATWGAGAPVNSPLLPALRVALEHAASKKRPATFLKDTIRFSTKLELRPTDANNASKATTALYQYRPRGHAPAGTARQPT